MTATLLLIRHASHDRLGKVLCGRMEGVGLSALGQAEAEILSARLAGADIAAIYASPQTRARETAEPLATRLSMAIETEPGLDEIDFGAWTGLEFEALDGDPRWRPWCEQRSANRPPPGATPGESMGEAQARAVRAATAIAARHEGGTVLLFSHADVIKAMICAWLRLSLDSYHRFDIDPASISAVSIGNGGAKVLRLNDGGRP